MEFIAPKFDSSAKRVRMVHGPYKIKGKDDKSVVGNSRSGDPNGSAYVAMADPSFPRDITVLHTDAYPAFSTGKNQYTKIKLSDGLYVHHTLFADQNHQATNFLACGETAVAQKPVSVFMAAGLEKSEFKYYDSQASIKAGYYIGPKSNILVNVDIVNYNTPAAEVYLVSEMEYLPGAPSKFLPAEFVNLDIGLCDGKNAGHAVHAPVGQTQWTLNGTEMTVTQSGWLTQIRGHLHGMLII
jgi:hypothetical protein